MDISIKGVKGFEGLCFVDLSKLREVYDAGAHMESNSMIKTVSVEIGKQLRK